MLKIRFNIKFKQKPGDFEKITYKNGSLNKSFNNFTKLNYLTRLWNQLYTVKNKKIF